MRIFSPKATAKGEPVVTSAPFSRKNRVGAGSQVRKAPARGTDPTWARCATSGSTKSNRFLETPFAGASFSASWRLSFRANNSMRLWNPRSMATSRGVLLTPGGVRIDLPDAIQLSISYNFPARHIWSSDLASSDVKNSDTLSLKTIRWDRRLESEHGSALWARISRLLRSHPCYRYASVLAAVHGIPPAGRQGLLLDFTMSGLVVAAPLPLLVAIQLAILVILHLGLGAKACRESCYGNNG